MKDVRFWSDFAHAHGAVLIVDEAHGAHFSLHPYFPESAVRCGADLNLMMKAFLGPRIKEGLDKMVDAMVDMSEGRMPEGFDPSKYGVNV